MLRSFVCVYGLRLETFLYVVFNLILIDWLSVKARVIQHFGFFSTRVVLFCIEILNRFV